MDPIYQVLAIVMLGAMIYLMLRAPAKIKESNANAASELKEFERGLECSIVEYTAYSTGHPYTWTEIEYDDFFESITTSASFSLFPPYWDKADVFCTKVDEENTRIYLIPRCKEYDWGKLMHYEEWLESNRKVAENIAK